MVTYENNFYRLEFVGRDSEPQLQVGENWNLIISRFLGLASTTLVLACHFWWSTFLHFLSTCRLYMESSVLDRLLPSSKDSGGYLTDTFCMFLYEEKDKGKINTISQQIQLDHCHSVLLLRIHTSNKDVWKCAKSSSSIRLTPFACTMLWVKEARLSCMCVPCIQVLYQCKLWSLPTQDWEKNAPDVTDKLRKWLYANGVRLSAIWENTALVQWIRCEPLGEYLIHWTCRTYCTIKSHMTYPTMPRLHYVQSTARVRYGLIPILLTSDNENHSPECEKILV